MSTLSRVCLFVLFISILNIPLTFYFSLVSFPLISYILGLCLFSSITLYLLHNPTTTILRLFTLKYLLLLESYFGIFLLSYNKAPYIILTLVFASILLYLLITVHIAPTSLYQQIHYVKFANTVNSATSFFSAESFYSPLLSAASDPFTAVPEISGSCTGGLRLSDHEREVVDQLQIDLLNRSNRLNEYTELDWLKIAWCRQLDVPGASEVYRNFIEYTNKFKIGEIPVTKVRENFHAGFSVLAGKDMQGRVMLWQRMCFMTPATIPLDVGIKSTWLALDAGLSDEVSNRLGVALVYDFCKIGFSNITLNVLDIKHGALACGAAHPSHISRVVFLNAPTIFKLAFTAVKPLLPRGVVEVVEFVNSDENEWYKRLCTEDQLPRYLSSPRVKGEYEEPLFEDTQLYLNWLFEKLTSHHLIYL
jgi:hypothetical protein